MGKKGKNDNQAPKSKEPSQGTAGIAEMGKAFLLSDRWKKIQAHCLKSDDPTIVEAIKEGEIELHGIFEFISAKIDRLMRKQIKFKKAINKKIKTLEMAMANEIANRLKSECKSLESTVMVRGIEYHQMATGEKRKETEGETRVQTIDILTKLGLKLSLAGIQVYRLPQREITLRDGKKIWTDTVKITFPNLQEKIDLFKCLATNGKDYKNIKVHDAIPQDLIAEKRETDDLASDYRTKFPGTKTRTLCRFGKIL